MGIFGSEPKIGGSNLTKSEVDRFLDLNNDYRTDYTYVSSRSYRPDGSEQYENPRMTRMSLESFRRKRAFENAWKSGYIQYFWMCLMDFLQRFIANPAKVSGSIVGSVAYFVVQAFWTVVNLVVSVNNQGERNVEEPAARLRRQWPQQVHRHSYEYDEQYDWVTDDSSQVSETIRRRPFPLQTSSTFANEVLNESATVIESYRNANKPKTSIVWRSLRGVLRGCLYITTMGLYPSDFWQKQRKPRDVRRVDENVAGGDEVAFTRASATSLNRPSRSWIDSISAFSPSDDSVIQQQHQQDQQTYFDGPPPSYDETWEMQEGGSRLAPRISTPLNPTTPRQPAISIRDQQQQQTPNADGPVLGFLWTILSETLEFWITLYEIVARNIRLVKDKTVNLFSPRDEVVYNLRSRSVRAPSLQRQPPSEHLPESVSLYKRTLKNVYDMSASALKTMLSIGSSVLLAPVMITTYLVSTAIDKTRHRETVTPLQAATTPSSRSDYMVGRAFGIIADFLYSVVKGFMDLVIFLLNVPMMVFSCIRENTMPLLRRIFTGTDDEAQRSTHAMTTRAMSRGGSAVRGGSVGPQLQSASERGYKRCLIWLIPLIGFLLLSGLVAKRCYDDEEIMANSEMLQYPTVIVGRTYEAASSVGQSVWWKICSLAIAGRTAAHATKERVITTLASQPWTSQWKIANTYESTKKTVSKTFSDAYSGAHSRVLYVRDYLSSAADEAHVIPEYVYGTGSSAVGKITEFLQAIIDGIRQLADSVWQNILPGWAYLKEHFRKLLTVRWEERIKSPQKVAPVSESSDQSALQMGLEELRREKTVMSKQLEQLRREREFDEERHRELWKAIELNQIPLHKQEPLHTSSDIGREKHDDEVLQKKIEQQFTTYVMNFKELEDNLINKRLGEMESRLMARLEQLSSRIESDFDQKLGKAKRESGDGQSSLSNEISDLASAIANQRNEFDMFRRERDEKLTQLAHSVMIIESGQSEDIKQIQLQINNLIKDEVARNLRSELSNLSEKSENEMESVREDIYKQIENRVMTLFAAQVARTVHESGTDEAKIIEKDKTEANHLSESDLLVVRNLIVDALRVYDADKTGKVDYALESSGGSIISTRCTETYKETSRLESIFGIPLWYSSYSPRSVIQHRANALSSGECWAFRGKGYLTIKLSTPIHVTEVSYEHLRHELHPDGVMRSAPKQFQIWAFQALNDFDSKVLLGEYQFDHNGDALQFFKVEHEPPIATPILELVVLSNWGADYTCLYRFRVHGHKPGKSFRDLNEDDALLVDHKISDEFVRGTQPGNK